MFHTGPTSMWKKAIIWAVQGQYSCKNYELIIPPSPPQTPPTDTIGELPSKQLLFFIACVNCILRGLDRIVSRKLLALCFSGCIRDISDRGGSRCRTLTPKNAATTRRCGLHVGLSRAMPQMQEQGPARNEPVRQAPQGPQQETAVFRQEVTLDPQETEHRPEPQARCLPEQACRLR